MKVKRIVSIASTAFLVSSLGLAKDHFNQDQMIDAHQSPSGFYVNASGGLAQTTATYQADTSGVFGDSNVNVKFPTQHQGAASLGAGYKWGFGKTNSFKNIFFGPSINYYYFGKSVDPINSNVNDYTGQIISTEYTQLSGIDVEGFLGMYLSSPLSLQVGFGIGGGVGENQQGLLGVFNAKLAYDLSSHLRIYAQYIRADFTAVGFAFLGFFNFTTNTDVGVDSEQIGIEYLF